MHLAAPLILSLPVLTSAQAQKPLTEQVKHWFSAATSSILAAVPTGTPPIPENVKHPVAAAAAKGASLKVHPVTMRNYQELLAPDSSRPGTTEWMILVSGGNKTCGGHCTRLEVAFNETASLLAADPTAPKLGYINCDSQAVLCTTWTAKPPTIWYIQRPHPGPGSDQSVPASSIHINYLNFTETTASDMVALHTGKKYEEGYLYEGAFQPFDGLLAQYGLSQAVGYVVFVFGLVPSWAFMLIISMVTRQAM